MYQVREAGYATLFPARETTRPWILTFPCSMRLSRGDTTLIRTSLPSGEPWRNLRLLQTREVRKISKHDLSPLFLEYYWPLEIKYHIRQGIDPDKDPVVMVRIRQLLKAGKITQGETLKDFQKRMPEEHKTLLDQSGTGSLRRCYPTLPYRPRCANCSSNFHVYQERREKLATQLN